MSNENRLWWRDGVIYQIYPRSFADANNDGIGDLTGIHSKLDYLEELGVDALWLSPIYPSPDVDFGYDVADYCGIDPKFGTMQEFDQLLEDAHQCGIRIVLDLVLNHTSDQHPWFLESKSSRDNPKRDWYIWRPPSENGGLPNNWASVFGGHAWELDKTTGEYYYHMFYKQQPDLNWRNPEVRAAMLDVFRFWLEKGVDGFRLDVFNLYFKHPDMPDNPPKLGIRKFDRQRHVYDLDQPEMIPLFNEVRALLDSYSERYMIGETFGLDNDPAQAASYCGDDKLHAAFCFEFTKAPWNAAKYQKAVKEWEAALSGDAWPNYVLNNHDLIRSATRFGEGESDERMKAAAALLLTQRGTPYIYYGEEIGMRDVPVSRAEIQDPIGKRYWPFHKGRDGCRAPIQWSPEKNAGFCSVEPWLKVHPDHKTRNVQAQREDPQSLYHFYRQLISLRKEYKVLRSGETLPLIEQPKAVMAYLRKDEEQTALVVLNFSKRQQDFSLEAEEDWTVVLSTHARETVDNGVLKLASYEVLIAVKSEK